MPPEPTIEALLARIGELLEELKRAQQKNALLEQKLDLLVRKIFGKKSEQLSSGQLELLLGGEPPPRPKSDACWTELDQQARGTKPPAASKQSRRPRLPEHLPVREEVIEPLEVQRAPELWRRIGQEVNERLDYEPGRFLRLRTVRPTYVRRRVAEGESAPAPVTAPLPPMLLERGLLGPGLMAHVLVSKFADHLPLYRQEGIYQQRYGVELPRQTLARAVETGAFWLELIYHELRAQTFAGGYVQIDETPIRYLAPGAGQTKQGYFWTVLAPYREGFFHWAPSRAAKVLEDIVPADFAGRIQADGYEAYASFLRQRAARAESSAEESPPIVLAGCLAHVRRHFFEAKEHAPQQAGWVLRQIDALYDLERELRAKNVGPRLREVARSELCALVFPRLRQVLEIYRARREILPQSSLGKAVRHALGQWTRLEVWAQDGVIEVDNNLVENAIRPTAVGKKNWLFIGSEDAGPRAAVVYTVLASCRRHGVDPFEYLRDVFTRLPAMTRSQIPDNTPAAWAKERQAKAAPIEPLPLAA